MRSMRTCSVGVALVLAAVVGGCEVVTGLTGDATLLQPDAGTGGAGSTGPGGPGSGGHATPGFAFAITDTSVKVPYGGLNFVDVELTPSGGFNGDVEIAAQGAPAGLVTMPLTIPAGGTTGKLQIGAGTTLAIGTTFTLTLAATSGSIVKTAMVPAVVTGKPGDLDQTFGGVGVVTGPKGSGNAGGADLYDVREVGQGKILAAGDTYTSMGKSASIGLRFLSSGMPDTSFNVTGVVSNTYLSSSCSSSCLNAGGRSIGVQREIDGTTLFVGSGNPGGAGKTDDLFLFRYKDDGTPSVVQGDPGTEDIDLGGDEEVLAAALLPSSTHVIVAGAKDGQLFVARIPASQAGGHPDTGFASPTGFIVPALGGTGSTAAGLTIDSMGRIVVVGRVATASGNDMVVLRLTSDGALDASFGSGGTLILARPGNQAGTAVIVQADGNLVMAGDTDEGGANQLLVQRFLPSGAVDATFGAAGVVLLPLGGASPSSSGPRLVGMPDGRLVVAGNGSIAAPTSSPVIARLLPDGSPDPTFGVGGQVSVYVGDWGLLEAMALASDGKLLIAGSIGASPSGTFLARLWN
jgi:uncharacterized delta-60 repeat protein